MSKTRPVMFATDFSPASLPAFSEALAIAKSTGAELLVMHALPSPMPVMSDVTYVDPETWNRILSAQQTEAHRQIDALVAQARGTGVSASGFILDAGIVAGAADEIVRAAQDKDVRMLVLGTHGRTGVARFFLGSVAARVVATASCPVLTVRGPHNET